MKRWVAILAAASCALLSGCQFEVLDAKTDELLEKMMLEDNDQYQDYESKKSQYNDKINAEGYYFDSENDMSEFENHKDMIHVSFAENSLLYVTYFSDEDRKEVIDPKNCFLEPGDTIYATINSTSLAQSNTYEFEGFTIAVFDGEQSNLSYAFFKEDKIVIPPDLQYKEISIIPEGSYKNRDLSFSAEYKDVNGETETAAAVWTIVIDNQSYSTKSENYSVEANATFRVTAQYDPDEYYLIEDEVEPKCEKYDDKSGTVTFMQYNAKSAVDNYKLVFGKKYDISIGNVNATGPVTVYIGDDKYEDAKFPLNKSAKSGDKVTIESTGMLTGVESTKNLRRDAAEGFVYTVCDDSIFVFDPDSYKYDNGKVEFYDISNKIIDQKTNLNNGDIIYYKGIPDTGYQFNNSEEKPKLKVDSDIEYNLKNEIRFTQKQKIVLEQPEKGGTITYYLNGSEIKNTTVYLASGTDKLTASFSAETRYKVNNLSDNAECIISTTDHNIKFKNNDGKEVSINDVFKPSDSQKAKLNVKLDDSVGAEIKFNIYNGTDEPINDKKSYISKELFDSWGNPLGLDDNELLENASINAVDGLKISVSDRSRLNTTAIRIDVTKKKNTKEDPIKEKYYILESGGSQFITTNAGSNAYFTEIDIVIREVTGSKINLNNFKIENSEVKISYEDTSNTATIKNGEFVDDGRKIKITVTANEHYQVKVKKDKKEKYSVTCKYKELDKKFSEMRSDIKIVH